MRLATRVVPEFARELAAFGATDVSKCFNCGNCTAICPLAEGSENFSLRKSIRHVQLGLKDRLKGDLTPWLCYECTDCTVTCPRNANPSETMHALRRWLTAQYDWTGLSKKLFTSSLARLASIAVVMLLTVLTVVVFHGPLVTDQVALATFAPTSIVQYFGILLAVVVVSLILSNIYRMYRFVSNEENRPKRSLLRSLLVFAKHVPIEIDRRMSECFSETRGHGHMMMTFGSAAAVVAFVVFTPWFLTNEVLPVTHPTKLFGYALSVVLLYGSSVAIIGRIRKKETFWQTSLLTDWSFLILLFFTALSGVAVYIFEHSGMPIQTYAAFTIHLAFVVPLAVLEVPFAKWTHAFYRFLAIYFDSS
jgi:quinone-modifying oxidoreductase subunit QmoC